MVFGSSTILFLNFRTEDTENEIFHCGVGLKNPQRSHWNFYRILKIDAYVLEKHTDTVEEHLFSTTHYTATTAVEHIEALKCKP